MISLLKSFKYIDLKIAQTHLMLRDERPALIILLFHTIFRDEEEKNRRLVYPLIGMKLENFREIINIFLNHGYRFLAPDTIPHGMDYSKRYILITFDDGYFNNTRVLPLLKEYDIPSVFFISTNHIREGKCYWWDVVYRACQAKGMSAKRTDAHIGQLKSQTHDVIEQQLKDTYSIEVNKPLDDLDRPFTPDELQDFAREKQVYLGNHTSDHAILTNYSPEAVKQQIVDAQKALFEMAHYRPNIISYPNGNYTPEIMTIARESGLQIGITVENRKNYLPIETSRDSMMRLGRFMPVEGHAINHQCDLYRSDFILSRIIKHQLSR